MIQDEIGAGMDVGRSQPGPKPKVPSTHLSCVTMEKL